MYLRLWMLTKIRNMKKNVQMWAKQRREDECGRRHEYEENDEEQEVFKLYIHNNILHLRMTPTTKTTHIHNINITNKH